MIKEDTFEGLKKLKTTETWVLIRDVKQQDDGVEDVKQLLEKPRYELLKYDVHPNALTQSGNYHFSECYQVK